VQDLRIDDPCVLFALSRERAPFCREFPPQQTFPGAPCWARFSGPAWLSVLVVETGIGQANVAVALDWLLSKPKFEGVPYEPKLMIFAGFAGALSEGLGVGDVLLADEVIDERGQCWRTTWPATLPEGRWSPPLHRGRLLTMDRLIATPEEKRQLATQQQAAAVDMESSYFAARSAKAGVPFACVRAISDDVTTGLSPALVSLLSGGSASWWRAFWMLARKPSMFRELRRLARDTKQASTQLGKSLGELLTLTLPWDLEAPG
jgi:adenosylhomocysteine nucleosidase